MTRTIVSGRVRYGETVRDALFRHLENDLGPMAFPLLPPQPVPFTVAEYFPMPGLSAFHDDRQHAVSLAFVVPVTGTCEPRQDALEVTWMPPAEAASDALAAEMEGGRGTLDPARPRKRRRPALSRAGASLESHRQNRWRLRSASAGRISAYPRRIPPAPNPPSGVAAATRRHPPSSLQPYPRRRREGADVRPPVPS